MIVLDSSALLALTFCEPGHERLLDAVAEADWIGVGAPTWAETGMVVSARLGEEAPAALALLHEHLDLRIVSFEAAHAREARAAFVRFGRGRHAAALNFGDCMTYAVAKVSGLPLLYVGEDFARTDLEPALDGSAGAPSTK